MAQLVEHHLAKVRVAGSNPVVRSETSSGVCWSGCLRDNAGGVAEWFRQGPAKPCTRVRFPPPPRAVSSAGERLPDTEEVTGSIPVPPTSCPGWPLPAESAGQGATRHAGRGGDPRGPHVPTPARSSHTQPPKRKQDTTHHAHRGTTPQTPRSGGSPSQPYPAPKRRQETTHHAHRGDDPRRPHIPTPARSMSSPHTVPPQCDRREPPLRTPYLHTTAHSGALACRRGAVARPSCSRPHPCPAHAAATGEFDCGGSDR